MVDRADPDVVMASLPEPQTHRTAEMTVASPAGVGSKLHSFDDRQGIVCTDYALSSVMVLDYETDGGFAPTMNVLSSARVRIRIRSAREGGRS